MVKKNNKKEVNKKETKIIKLILVKIKNIILYPFKLIISCVLKFVKFLKVKTNQFKTEISKVRWPNKKEMIKYSIATIMFVLFFGVFFYLIELLMVLLKTLI